MHYLDVVRYKFQMVITLFPHVIGITSSQFLKE